MDIINPEVITNNLWSSSEPYPPPITVHNTQIEQVSPYKYLGIYVDAALSWNTWSLYICSKVQQRIYFSGRPRSF